MQQVLQQGATEEKGENARLVRLLFELLLCLRVKALGALRTSLAQFYVVALFPPSHFCFRVVELTSWCYRLPLLAQWLSQTW